MGLVHTIPETNVTVPTFLRGAPNGQLPAEWLRSPELSTALHRQMFVPVSYAMQAMHLAAAEDAVLLRTTGRYRTYAQQVTLFRSRYKLGANVGCGSKLWDSNGDGVKERWYMQANPTTGRCYAMAAVPGTSNHGLGLADDLAEQDDADPEVESIDDVTLQWLKDNAGSFGFALDTHSERWHWHWHNGDALTQRTVDVLHAAGVKVQGLGSFGFTAPSPSTGEPIPPPTPEPPAPPIIIEEDDDMTPIIAKEDGGGPWFYARGPRTGALRVGDQVGHEVPTNYPISGLGAYDLGAKKLVTSWSECVPVTKAIITQYMGPEIN